MLYEFALEPEVLSTWENFRYFIEKFGVDQGRLIARYPKRWKKLVYEALRQHRGTARMAMIEERLRRIDHRLIDSHRSYDGEKDWLENAEEQQGDASPFRAIIASSSPRGHSDVLLADDLSDQDTRWHVPRECCIPRTAADLATAVGRLVQVSHEVLIVDPHFDPQERRWRTVLGEILARAARASRPHRRIELHSRHRRGSAVSQEWVRSCNEWLPRIAAEGISIRVVRWEAPPEGEIFHARYVLTERGGIRLDAGVVEGTAAQTTDVSLMVPEVYQRRWDDLQEVDDNGRPRVTTFTKFDEVTITGVGRTTRR